MNRIAVLTLLGFFFINPRAYAQNLTLDQTMNYLQSKVAEFGKFDQVTKGNHELSELTFWADTSKICYVRMTEMISFKPVGKTKFQDVQTWEYEVDLHHLDKEALDVYGSDGFVKPVTLTWRCKNSAQNIRRFNAAGKSGFDFKKAFNFRANVKDVERISKAFAHAVRLCEDMDVDPFD
ncbi:MAG: hypothetical protein ABJF04_11130 [Reichenbachiella sp.]|uniref:hypothetical protein n=1 Tax=Reichenbachiella sp. TaxID=2184521 RepID=UPI0032637F46